MIDNILKTYKQIEDYVHQYCDAHNFSEEELEQVKEYILYPAKKAVINCIIEEKLKELTDTLNTLLTTENK